MSYNRQWQQPPTEAEIDLLVRGYTEKQLRVNFRNAAKHPGTTWHVILLGELRRRGLDPEGGAS